MSCRHSLNNAVLMQQAIMKGDRPALRHIPVGLTSYAPLPPCIAMSNWRYWIGKGVLYRTLVALAVLFMARAWTYDESYVVALAWTATVLLAIDIASAMLTGWLLELGGELCNCGDGHGDHED